MTDHPTRGMVAAIQPCEYGDCSNGGISGRVRVVTLVDGKATIDARAAGVSIGSILELRDPTDVAPAVMLVQGNLGGDTARALPALWNEAAGSWEPFRHTGRLGPMMGGAHVLCPGVWRGPVPLHDRWETPAQYNALST